MCDLNDTSDLEDDVTPLEITNKTQETNNAPLPGKSRLTYEKCYHQFLEWKTKKNVSSLSETILLSYFQELASKYKSSTLWTTYSILKATLCLYHQTDISKYSGLNAFLKQKAQGYTRKKSETFSPEEINTFLNEAPNDLYLFSKVAFAFGILGACRRQELHDIQFEDVQVLDKKILVMIANNEKLNRSFIITGRFYELVMQYIQLRPNPCTNSYFFLNYQNGKCTNQNVGINKFGNLGKVIAKYLKLPNPGMYTGHCFRRTSATLLVDGGGDITSLKQIHNGRRKWAAVAGRKNGSTDEQDQMSEQILHSHNKQFNVTLQICSMRDGDESFATPETSNKDQAIIASPEKLFNEESFFFPETTDKGQGVKNELPEKPRTICDKCCPLPETTNSKGSSNGLPGKSQTECDGNFTPNEITNKALKTSNVPPGKSGTFIEENLSTPEITDKVHDLELPGKSQTRYETIFTQTEIINKDDEDSVEVQGRSRAREFFCPRTEIVNRNIYTTSEQLENPQTLYDKSITTSEVAKKTQEPSNGLPGKSRTVCEESITSPEATNKAHEAHNDLPGKPLTVCEDNIALQDNTNKADETHNRQTERSRTVREESLTPPEATNKATDASNKQTEKCQTACEESSPEMPTKDASNELPGKSRIIYEKRYREFLDWKKSQNISSFSEKVMLAYFQEMSTKYKSPTIWSMYSMLRSTISLYQHVDISRYNKLMAFIKRKSDGYKMKQAKTFSPEEINTFIDEAPNLLHLLTKVVMIFGIMGACRRQELHELLFSNVAVLESSIVVKIINTKTRFDRSFTLTGRFYEIVKEYINLRPNPCTNPSFFLHYTPGKCMNLSVGINKFGNVGKVIAMYLKLPNPELYTGHCFRRTSATLLVGGGGEITSLKRFQSGRNKYIVEAAGNNDSAQKQLSPSLAQEISSSKAIRNKSGSTDSAGEDDSSNAQVSANGPVQPGVKLQCKACHKLIVGFRLRCVECADFDMCSGCETIGTHGDHYMLRVPARKSQEECARLVKALRGELQLDERSSEDEPLIKVEIKQEIPDDPLDDTGGPAWDEESDMDQSFLTFEIEKEEPGTDEESSDAVEESVVERKPVALDPPVAKPMVLLRQSKPMVLLRPSKPMVTLHTTFKREGSKRSALPAPALRAKRPAPAAAPKKEADTCNVFTRETDNKVKGNAVKKKRYLDKT